MNINYFLVELGSNVRSITLKGDFLVPSCLKPDKKVSFFGTFVEAFAAV